MTDCIATMVIGQEGCLPSIILPPRTFKELVRQVDERVNFVDVENLISHFMENKNEFPHEVVKNTSRQTVDPYGSGIIQCCCVCKVGMLGNKGVRYHIKDHRIDKLLHPDSTVSLWICDECKPTEEHGLTYTGEDGDYVITDNYYPYYQAAIADPFNRF